MNRDTVVRKESLAEGSWKLVGGGGFGRVYKARHKDWGFDVAVKILKKDASHFMFKEAQCMELASCEFVLRVYGIYEESCLEFPEKRGLVMEYMKRGSLQSLLEQLSAPPPWPLAFRLAYQTALAMNFLHVKNIVHRDLKLSNVLLNDDLNAKLADFGLSQVSRSVLKSSTDSSTGPQGTYKYMPPEAFDVSYKPVRSFDIYSYAILLWSIFSGEEPYSMATYSLVEVRIPKGDRPPCEEILSLQVEGVDELVDLMKRCWDMKPSERPHFRVCLEVTGRLFSRHSKVIHRVVDTVLTKLDSQSHEQHLMPYEHHGTTPSESVDLVKPVVQQAPTGVSSKTMTNKEKAKFVDHHRPELIKKVSKVLAISEELRDMVHDETYSLIKAKEICQDKMRVLYGETLRSGGDRVKAAFYDALKKHEPNLMQELED